MDPKPTNSETSVVKQVETITLDGKPVVTRKLSLVVVEAPDEIVVPIISAPCACKRPE